jgi:hypothetical protein
MSDTSLFTTDSDTVTATREQLASVSVAMQQRGDEKTGAWLSAYVRAETWRGVQAVEMHPAMAAKINAHMDRMGYSR